MTAMTDAIQAQHQKNTQHMEALLAGIQATVQQRQELAIEAPAIEAPPTPLAPLAIEPAPADLMPVEPTPEEPAFDEDAVTEAAKKLEVVELRAALEAAGADTKGLKAALVARLVEVKRAAAQKG